VGVQPARAPGLLIAAARTSIGNLMALVLPQLANTALASSKAWCGAAWRRIDSQAIR
jgi:hypothetical protein